MIDLRVYAALEVPLIQANEHLQCCLYGDCESPDVRTYIHTEPLVPHASLASVIADLIHQYLSELGDESLMETLRM